MTTTVGNQGFINHVTILLDMSSSMSPWTKDVVKVTDGNVQFLATRSQELDQETRATVYTFNTIGWQCQPNVQCVYFDKDVLRLPSIEKYYRPSGRTPLMQAADQAINELGKTSTLYGDHAFLLYVVTDGEENNSHFVTAQELKKKIESLPDNWTVAALVPNSNAIFSTKQFGFPPGNIEVWDTTNAQGIREVGETIRRATDNFMQARAKGVRGSKNLFQIDVSKLDKTTVTHNLQKLPQSKYQILSVNGGPFEIAEFVQQRGHIYTKGQAYYQMVKSEIVQPQKQVCVVDKSDGSVYTGDAARQLIGLPDYTLRVRPADHPKYDIYIQSTSYNRKLHDGSKLLLRK